MTPEIERLTDKCELLLAARHAVADAKQKAGAANEYSIEETLEAVADDLRESHRWVSNDLRRARKAERVQRAVNRTGAAQ